MAHTPETPVGVHAGQPWPTRLDVQNRLSLEFLEGRLQHFGSGGPRTWSLRLAPHSPEADRQAFLRFLHDMAGRRRMGLVHLDSSLNLSLWLVPASQAIAQRLKVSPLLGSQLAAPVRGPLCLLASHWRCSYLLYPQVAHKSAVCKRSGALSSKSQCLRSAQVTWETEEMLLALWVNDEKLIR